MSATMNIHNVVSIEVQERWLAEPGDDKNWPDGLVYTRIKFHGVDDVPLEITCFNTIAEHPIPLHSLAEAR
jgi:hypothetical protein